MLLTWQDFENTCENNTVDFEHLCRRCQVCHPAGGARLRTDCRHEPADLHDQSHRTDRRHREPAAPAGEAALSRA